MSVRSRYNGGGGTTSVRIANFIENVNIAGLLSVVMNWLSSAVAKPAVALSTLLTYTPPVTPAALLTNLISGTGQVSEAPATALSTVMSNNAGLETPAGKIVQIQYDLVQTRGATSVTGSGTWTNPTNAQGTHNSTNATNANTISAAASGTITGSYAAESNKTDLTISSVILNIYGSYAAGAVTPSTATIQYSLDGGTNYATPESVTTSWSNPSTPKAFDITSAVAGDWSKLTNLKVRIGLTGAASATVSTLNIDAMECVVTASGTQIP